MRYITLTFNDGLINSTLRTVELFSRYDLVAEFNAIATAHLVDNDLPETMKRRGYYGGEYCDFRVWNEIQKMGHVVQPHGYAHINKTTVEFEEAIGLINNCIEAFCNNLDGFDPHKAIFHFPNNASTPELEVYAATQFRCFRTAGQVPLNPLPTPETIKLVTWSHQAPEVELDACVREVMKRDDIWLIYALHGIDNEGWGPIRASYLQHLINRLKQTEGVKLLPTWQVLEECGADEGGLAGYQPPGGLPEGWRQ